MNSNLDVVNLPHVVDVVETVIGCALQLDKERTGGYFCLADTEDGTPIFILKVGVLRDTQKAKKYLHCAQEKCLRLVTRGGTLASETRNPTSGEYAGAVKGKQYIYSFSGFPEFLDEATMLLASAADFSLEPEMADSLARVSANPFYVNLKDLFAKL